MINKEKFTKYMNELYILNKVEHTINDAIKKTNKFEFLAIDFAPYETLVVDMLGELMEDTSDWIPYFIYELNFGENYDSDIMISDANGIFVKMSSFDDLYSILTEGR
jgi:hypothetical protein